MLKIGQYFLQLWQKLRSLHLTARWCCMHAGCTHYSTARPGASSDHSWPADWGSIQDPGHGCVGVWGRRYASPYVSSYPPRIHSMTARRPPSFLEFPCLVSLLFLFRRFTLFCSVAVALQLHIHYTYRYTYTVHSDCIFLYIQTMTRYASSGYCMIL